MSLRTKLNGLSSSMRFDNSIQLILDRVFFRSSRFVPHRLNGVDLVADQKGGDECGIRPCLVEGMYDPFLEVAGLLRGGRALNVVDLGANAGGFSLIFATRGIPVRKIASVEMNPLTYSRMRLNVLTAYGPKADPVNAAVGRETGKVRVPFSYGGTGESVNHKHEDDVGFTVPVVTFDELLDRAFLGEKVDIVKMDIEGSEWDVLDSGACQRLKDCSCLIVEIHPRDGRGVEDFEKAAGDFGLVLSPMRNPQELDVFCFVRS